MAYRNEEGKIVSGKEKKKAVVNKKKKSRKGEIVWAIINLKLVVGKIKEELNSSCLIKTKDGNTVEIDNRKLRPGNDDDYFE